MGYTIFMNNAAKKLASPSEGAAEGGGVGGIPPCPSVPPSEARRVSADFVFWICVSDLAK